MAFKAKMKCPVCEGEAVISKNTLRLFKGMITLKENPIYKCIKCGEEFATGKMVDETLGRAKKQLSFKRQIISTGGSLAITFPSDLSEYYGLEKGEKVRLIPESAKEIRLVIG
ncbi:MAG: YgiT-type zinc finger protein [Candidatus Diapherotrites archaeon]